MPVNDKKRNFGKKLRALIDRYNSVLVVNADNVGSNQMQKIRLATRGEAIVLFGKNTTVRRVIQNHVDENPGHPISAILDHVRGNVGFIFTNSDVSKVRDIVQSIKTPAPARVGTIAPLDVFVEPGPTGCDPGQTGWFQALNIPTKINKGQIEMIARVHLIKVGDRVMESQAALLQRLDIKPFSYGLVATAVYDRGEMFDASVLDITPEVILSRFSSGLGMFSAFCLSVGYPTIASLPHSINNAYKHLIALALETGYMFPRAKKFEDFLKNPGAFAPAAASTSAAAAPAAAPVESSSSEEEEVGGSGGLFGGGSDSD